MPSWRTTPLPANWPTLRRSILRRDKHTCQNCGAAPATHVDHKHNAANGGTDHPDNLQTLCTNCHRHKTAHEANLKAQQWRQANPKTRPQPPHPGDTTPRGGTPTPPPKHSPGRDSGSGSGRVVGS